MNRETRNTWMAEMGEAGDKLFSVNLMALQLQLKTLLEDSGGDHVVKLLDALCRMTHSEQQIVLELFTGIINRIASGELRLESDQDQRLKEFEEKLYGEIMGSLQAASTLPLRKRLEVVDGGKAPPFQHGSGILDLNRLRKARGLGQKYPPPTSA
jgi:DNA-binding PucR family transcriptional regulator